MNDTNTPRREGASDDLDMKRYMPYFVAAAFALLFVLFAIYRPSVVSVSRPGVDTDAPTLPTPVDEKAAAAAADVALARTLLESKMMQLKEADTRLAEFNAEIQRWESQVTALLTNDDGRYLAADAILVTAFDTLYSKDRPSREDAAATLAKANAVRSFIEDSLSDPRKLLAPRKEIPTIVTIVLDELNEAIRIYRDDRETILASVQAARETGDQAEATLQEAIAKLKQDYAIEKMRLLAEAREQHEKENRERIAAVELRKRREIGEAEAKLKRAEMDRERSRIQTEAELTAARARAERLLARASEPAVQAKYAPFLSKGNSALVRHGMRQYRWGKSQGRPGPVSLSSLRIAGVFDDVKYFIAVATAPGNDRGSWPAPVTEEDWHRCEELFREFNELAPTWIELGVLNP